MSITHSSATSPIDTRQMVLLHRCMRHEIRLAPSAVRSVSDESSVVVVADHLDFLVTFVHHHHEIEDELLWPVLRPRLGADAQRTIDLMESQHDATAKVMQQLSPSIRAWRERPGPVQRDQLVAILDEWYPLLAEHLDAEEQRLLPLAARVMDASEWERLGDEGFRRSPKRYRSLALGMFDHFGDPEVVETMTASIPRLIRPMVMSAARRTFRRRAVRVHGTASATVDDVRRDGR